MHIYLATNNPHKVEEFRALFDGVSAGVELHPASAIGGMPTVEETAVDFAGNAKLKAAALLSALPAGGWALADDSGLVVDALGGAPGVYSARYAGPAADADANNAHLLAALQGVPIALRAAHFVCVLILWQKAASLPLVFQGKCHGRIGLTPCGRGGFGYDPLFIPDGEERTFAAMSASEKERISHRGRAFADLNSALRHAAMDSKAET